MTSCQNQELKRELCRAEHGAELAMESEIALQEAEEHCAVLVQQTLELQSRLREREQEKELLESKLREAQQQLAARCALVSEKQQ